MKTLELNISLRFKVLQILDGFKGRIEELAQVLDDVKTLRITEEEWTQAERQKNVVQTPQGPAENWTWENDKVPDKSVELSEFSVDFVRSYIKDKNEKGEFTLADKDLIALKKVLA